MDAPWSASLYLCFVIIVQHATTASVVILDEPQDVEATTTPGGDGSPTTTQKAITTTADDGGQAITEIAVGSTSGIDICSPNPCTHGECTKRDTGYECKCSNGWTGTNCTDTDDCYWDPCGHDCVGNGAVCDCKPGYNGDNCLDIGACWPRSCANGNCTTVDRRAVCRCSPGWTGTYCEVAMSGATTTTHDSASHVTTDVTITTTDATGNCSCEHGECTTLDVGYECSCLPGWSGAHCEIADECYWNPCTHYCPDSAGLCSCWPGWTDSNCQDTPMGECWPRSCVNGDCVGVGVLTVCTCWPGWTGTYCEDNIDDCWSDPCVNGCCTDKEDGYVCGCWPGWTGKNCDIRQDINECESNPCINDLQCEDLNKGYKCVY